MAMLGAVLEYLNNWFERNPVTRERNVVRGRFEARGGALLGVPEGFLADGQWLRIRGSRFSDGLHRWPCSDLTDEAFAGSVWALAVPQAVVDLAGEVEAWCEEYGAAQDSPYASESFGGYAYTKAGASGSQGGSQAATWQSAFAARLAPWRKL